MKTSKQILSILVGSAMLFSWVLCEYQNAYAYHNSFFLDASAIITGLFSNALLDNSSITKAGNFLISGRAGFIQFGGSVTSPNTFTSTAGFVGTGSSLTLLNAANLYGQVPAAAISGVGGKDFYTAVIGTSATGTYNSVSYVTTDQTGFNMAIDSCGTASACTIRVRRGTYTFTEAVQSSANITLDFEDGAVVVPANATTNLFSCSGTIRGLTIVSSGAAISWQGNYLLRINSSATAENITFRDSQWNQPLGVFPGGENAPIVLAGKRPWLRNFTIKNTGLIGSAAQKLMIKVSGAEDARVEGGNVETRCQAGAADVFVKVMDSYRTVIERNNIWASGDNCGLNNTIVNRGLSDGPSSGTIIRLNVMKSTYNFIPASAGANHGVMPLDLCYQCMYISNYLDSFPGACHGFNGTGVSSGAVIMGNYYGNGGGGQCFRLTSSANNTNIIGNVYSSTGGVQVLITDAGSNTRSKSNIANGANVADSSP